MTLFDIFKKDKALKTAPTAAQKASSVRSIKNGAYASALAVVMLVAVILLNLVVGALPTKFTQFDISTGGMFTLSDTTLTMLDALERDVTAYYLAETGSEDGNITRILDRYAGETARFSWQQRDPALYPTFAQQYNAANATSGSVIVVSGENSVLVDYYDMYETDYSNYYTTGAVEYNFAAENAITSAIAKVTRETAYQLYELTGHGETALESDYTETLENAGVTAADLNLVTAGTVPENAAAVLINAPQTDLPGTDVDALRTYLAGGGSVLVTTDLNCETPNLDALLAEFGMTRQPGLVIENDVNYYAYRYPATYLLPELKSNDVTSGMTAGLYVFTPVAQGILATQDEAETLNFTTLLSSSADSYSMQNYATAETAVQGEDDPAGPIDIAVAAENADTGAKVVWINCGNVLLSDMNTAVSGGNAQLFGSVVNWLNGEESVVVDSKSMSGTTLTVPAATATALGLLFVIVLPLTCLVIGLVCWIVRRRR